MRKEKGRPRQCWAGRVNDQNKCTQGETIANAI